MKTSGLGYARGVLALGVVLLAGCGDSEPQTPQGVVGVVTLRGDAVTVSIEVGHPVGASGSGGTGKHSFPQQIISTERVVDGLKFQGLRLEGEGHVVEVLAAKVPGESKVRLITESTVSMVLLAQEELADYRWRSVRARVDRGTHRVVLDLNAE